MAQPEKSYVLIASPFTATESNFEGGSDRAISFPLRDAGRNKWLRLFWPVATFILTLVIFIQSIYFVQVRVEADEKCLPSTNGLSRARNPTRQLNALSPFSSHNETEAALAWEGIKAGHGIVALDQEYIREHGLPKSMTYQEDASKHIYALEAYHAIHCIKVIRLHYRALEDGRAWNWSRLHDMHCFNALRQYVMCNPDDTLLNTTGHRDAGHHMQKHCQDWDSLRDWAEKRTANYFDREPGANVDSPWHRYTPGDGLPIGSL